MFKKTQKQSPKTARRLIMADAQRNEKIFEPRLHRFICTRRYFHSSLTHMLYYFQLKMVKINLTSAFALSA